MDEIVKTYKVSSLYVMCSYRESFCLSPLEANSCGIPAICFDSATGVLDIIEDGKNGFIIKNRDFNEMANKIIEYFNIKDKSKMQKYSLEVANKFSCKNISKLWFNLLDEYAVSAQSAANSSDSFSS
jgi:glycosyltransferase involved in cell wall biosynthesis